MELHHLSSPILPLREVVFTRTLSGADLRRADLSEAILIGANLSKANLHEANLSGAKLSGADLSLANLFGTNLSRADLSAANLNQVNLIEADLSGANLSRAHLWGAHLIRANLNQAKLNGATLTGAILREAILTGANLSGAMLSRADLRLVNLSRGDLSSADLSEANLSYSDMIGTNVTDAKLYKTRVYGVSAWDLEGEFREQKNLIITPDEESVITVDNIEIAQFIYLILNNKKIRDVINTLTSKTVLILGRFTPSERKVILDTLSDKLREYNLLPIVFDFDRPTDKDFTETIKTLAGMCYFVIADITNPKSSPLELQATIPDYQIPFVPIIQEGEYPFAMMVDLQKKYNWVLDTISYDSLDTLIEILKPHIIDPAIKKRDEL